MKEVRYVNSAGVSFKFVLEKDEWWSIYIWNESTFEWIPEIQSKDLEHCYEYCKYIEIPAVRLIEIC